MTIAIPVHGGTIKWNTTTTTYNSILEAKRLIFPKLSREFIDVTSLDSTNGVREKIPGLADPGSLQIPCNHANATYNLAKGYFDNKTLIYFETTLVLQDTETVAATFEFQGYVSPNPEDGDVDGAVMLMLDVEVTGAFTFTNGS